MKTYEFTVIVPDLEDSSPPNGPNGLGRAAQDHPDQRGLGATADP